MEKEGTIYYIAVVELDKKWWENNKDYANPADLKAALDEFAWLEEERNQGVLL